MESKKPIVYVLGVPGQFYLAEAVSKEFDRPVIGITNYARVEEKITPEIRATFDEIYSLPDFYLSNKEELEKMDEQAFDALFRDLEKKFGIGNNTILAQYDRGLRWASDYKKVRVLQLATMQFVDKFLSEVDPVFVLDGVVTYLHLILRAACREKYIPYPLTQNSRLNNHINMLHISGQHVGLQECFEDLQSGKKTFLSDEILADADRAFYEFINKPVRPAYAVNNSVIKLNFAKMFKNLLKTLRPEKLFPGQKVVAFDRAFNYESHPLVYLKKGLIGKYRRFEQKLKRVFDDQPDMNAPFIYLPLHYVPEVSDMYFGSACDHHSGFVAQFSKHIPADCQVYVKEHTSMLGQRPTAFYDELNSIYNVRVISPSVDTFELTRHARAVAAVTGTAGWEGFLLGTPVIALGDVFYNFLPGVFAAPVNDDLHDGLVEYLENFQSNEKERLNAFRAFYATCGKSKNGDIGYEVTQEGARENAVLFAGVIRKYFEEWGHTIHGDFDKDLLGIPKRGAA
ncbi:MAG: hypothetical protein DHS20C02_05640 [Micavibrio sp.]|nr:MAG: hypothetical protein DHS20C02_05640 [Micavibrio sp.]